MATVKMVKSKRKPVKKQAYSRKRGAAADRERREHLKSLTLPTKKKKRVLDLNLFSWLVYGVPKIGKTTFFSSFPDAIFLSTEPGTKGMEIVEFNAEGGGIVDWAHFLRAVELLEDTDRFKCAIVDTANNAFEFCCDYIVDKMGIPALGLNDDGEKDWGVSYKAVKKEFNSALDRILRTGRGLHFTSHAKETTVKRRSGGDFTRITTTLSQSAQDVLLPKVDHIWYCEYMQAKGRDVRVMVTQGSELINAGTREMTDYEIPRFLPLLKRGGFDMVTEAAKGEDVGLNPMTLMTSEAGASKTMSKVIAEEKGKALRKKRSKKVRVKRR